MFILLFIYLMYTMGHLLCGQSIVNILRSNTDMIADQVEFVVSRQLSRSWL